MSETVQTKVDADKGRIIVRYNGTGPGKTYIIKTLTDVGAKRHAESVKKASIVKKVDTSAR